VGDLPYNNRQVSIQKSAKGRRASDENFSAVKIVSLLSRSTNNKVPLTSVIHCSSSNSSYAVDWPFRSNMRSNLEPQHPAASRRRCQLACLYACFQASRFHSGSAAGETLLLLPRSNSDWEGWGARTSWSSMSCLLRFAQRPSKTLPSRHWAPTCRPVWRAPRNGKTVL
jgi:hypothetical protein